MLCTDATNPRKLAQRSHPCSCQPIFSCFRSSCSVLWFFQARLVESDAQSPLKKVQSEFGETWGGVESRAENCFHKSTNTGERNERQVAYTFPFMLLLQQSHVVMTVSWHALGQFTGHLLWWRFAYFEKTKHCSYNKGWLRTDVATEVSFTITSLDLNPDLQLIVPVLPIQ